MQHNQTGINQVHEFARFMILTNGSRNHQDDQHRQRHFHERTCVSTAPVHVATTSHLDVSGKRLIAYFACAGMQES